MDQYTNEMAESTPEQQHGNSIENKCLASYTQKEEVKPPCEVCQEDAIGLFNIHGQQLRNDLPFIEMLPMDRFLCKSCFCEIYPNDHKTKLWSK